MPWDWSNDCGHIDDWRAFVWLYSNLTADRSSPTDIYRPKLSAVPPGHVLSHALKLNCKFGHVYKCLKWVGLLL